VAVADPPADAAPVPVSWQGGLILGGLGLSLATTSWAQRPALPYGLRAGRHAVAVRAEGGWYPMDSDSIAPPVLLLIDERPRGSDSATAVYLATHGYIVVMGADAPRDVRGDARIALHPSNALLRIAVAGRSLTVAAVPGGGPEDHVRLRATLSHAVVAVALRGRESELDELARRLRAAGLTVSVGSETRCGRAPPARGRVNHR
jgi:hypothetical protein